MNLAACKELSLQRAGEKLRIHKASFDVFRLHKAYTPYRNGDIDAGDRKGLIMLYFAAQGNMGVKRPIVKGNRRRPEPFAKLPPDVHEGGMAFHLVSGAYPPEFLAVMGKTTGTGKQKIEGAAANYLHGAADSGKPPFLCLPQKGQS
jgi:hypothetical protein